MISADLNTPTDYLWHPAYEEYEYLSKKKLIMKRLIKYQTWEEEKQRYLKIQQEDETAKLVWRIRFPSSETRNSNLIPDW